MAACSIGSRCHVAGVGIPRFGSKFPSATVLRLASSSVLLIDTDGPKHVASGVLISRNVVLCAAHSVAGASTKLEILLFFECDEKTAPGFSPSGTAPHAAITPPASPPPPCTPLATVAQAKAGKVIESGDALGLDYALVAIEWTSKKVKFPRQMHFPTPDYFYGDELLAVGHPVVGYKGEPTQAAAGKHIGTAAHGPHPKPKTPEQKGSKEYTYANFRITDGMSGGGVFNEKGNIVGIITGARPGPTRDNPYEYGFLNLGLVVGKTVAGPPAGPASARLTQWMGGGSPLLPGDPQPAGDVSFTPSL
jgi:Trypsin-like peptidase domain